MELPIILYVDDETINLELLQLTPAGYTGIAAQLVESLLRES